MDHSASLFPLPCRRLRAARRALFSASGVGGLLIVCVACARQPAASPAAHDATAPAPTGASPVTPTKASATTPAKAGATSGAASSAPARGLLSQGVATGTSGELQRQLSAGDRALDAGELDAAREHYREAQALAPSAAQPWVGLARVQMAPLSLSYGALAETPSAQAAGEAALGDLARALERDPQLVLALFERGRLLLALGRPEEAEPVLGRVLRSAPNDAEAASALAVARLATGDVAGAVAGFEQAVALEPQVADRQANLGTAYMMQGDVNRATSAYERAVRLQPDDARLQSDVGTAYLAAGRIEEAKRHLARAVALAPERATVLSNLAYAHLAAGESEQAEQIAARATSLDPKLGSAWINLGTARARRGDLARARQAFEHARQLDPSDPRAQESLRDLEELEQRAE